MRFAVFLCYSVQYLYVIQCSFVVFVPPFMPLSSNGNKWHEDGLKLRQKKDNPEYNSEIPTATRPRPSQYAKWLLLKFRWGTIPPPPTPHPKGTWLITASCRRRSRNIPNRGQDEGAPNFRILQLFQTIIFTLLNLLLHFSVLCSKIYNRWNANLKKNSSYNLWKNSRQSGVLLFPTFFVLCSF